MTHKTWANRVLPALMCVLVLLACSPPPLAEPPAPTPGPLDLIKALNSAINQGDTDAGLDLFVDEGLRYEVIGHYAGDKESLRYELDWWSTGASPQDTFTGCESEGEEVTCVWEKHGECLLGFDVLRFQITFTFQDNRIQGMRGDFVKDQLVAYSAAMAEMFQWLAENDPELGRELERASSAPDRSGRKAGELLVEICREYVEATAD